MTQPSTHLLALEDLLGDLQHARRTDDLGRLALLVYCEVRPWARRAGQFALADQIGALVTARPRASREEFLREVDALIAQLERLRQSLLVQLPLAG